MASTELSGKRISEISEPLAEGRFSILYISTYQTDFVLVSEPKLYQVVKALRHNGFEVENESYLEEQLFEYYDERLAIEESMSNSPVNPTKFLLDTNVLVNELQCVGLNRHDRANWVHTVLKILCYPDLLEINCG